MIQLDQEEKKKEASKEYATPEIKGKVEFRDVDFVYPTRPDAQVLRKLSLSVEPGKTIALVGASGCGKSTGVNAAWRAE